MKPISQSLHSIVRLSERTSLTVADVNRYIETGSVVPLGSDPSRGLGYLLYSPADDGFFVLVVSKDRAAVMTVLTEEMAMNSWWSARLVPGRRVSAAFRAGADAARVAALLAGGDDLCNATLFHIVLTTDGVQKLRCRGRIKVPSLWLSVPRLRIPDTGTGSELQGMVRKALSESSEKTLSMRIRVGRALSVELDLQAFGVTPAEDVVMQARWGATNSGKSSEMSDGNPDVGK